VVVLQLYPEHRVGQQLGDHAVEFENFLFRHYALYLLVPLGPYDRHSLCGQGLSRDGGSRRHQHTPNGAPAQTPVTRPAPVGRPDRAVSLAPVKSK
jgi:hypothetical protein